MFMKKNKVFHTTRGWTEVRGKLDCNNVNIKGMVSGLDFYKQQQEIISGKRENKVGNKQLYSDL